MAEATLPTNYLDWKLKHMSVPLNADGETNQPGRRDRVAGAEEPKYVLVRSDDIKPRHLGITQYSIFEIIFNFFSIFYVGSYISCRLDETTVSVQFQTRTYKMTF